MDKEVGIGAVTNSRERALTCGNTNSALHLMVVISLLLSIELRHLRMPKTRKLGIRKITSPNGLSPRPLT